MLKLLKVCVCVRARAHTKQ